MDSAADKKALKALEYDWGKAYLIGCDDERGWWAARRDRPGDFLTAAGPDELRVMIRGDYEFRQVPRGRGAGDDAP